MSTLINTDVKGFPIISSNGEPTLLGYIGRTELRYVLDKVRKLEDIPPETPCSFFSEAMDHQHPDFPGLASGPALGIEEEIPTALFRATASNSGVKFWPWVNQTPLTVSPRLPLEIVMQMFKRMGPRVILVEDHGVLVGLVTVKDVLRFTALEKPDEPSWHERGGLHGMLEEAWVWATNVMHNLVLWLIRR